MLKAPFPWFGGKSKVASLVWRALGDVKHYVEPFAGSLAVLLGRPTEPRHETVNDIDMYIVNFWRALQHDPEGVAHYANNLVNEADLTARHIWLVNTGAERIARIQGDSDYYDVKVAGWWVWGICCWIGRGWCAGNGPWSSKDGKLFNLRGEQNTPGQGVRRQLIHLGNPGQGVNRQLVHLGNPGQGVNRQRVHLGNPGQGVNRKGIHEKRMGAGTATGEAQIAAYLSELAERLRYVRVCCGDWTRVVTPGALAYGNPVGIFLDPPYDASIRCDGVYNTDSERGSVSAEVREWCIANGDNPRYRIVLAGYEGEHDMPDSWKMYLWTASSSYQTADSAKRDDGNQLNRTKERLWFSPHCLPLQGAHNHNQINFLNSEVII